MTIPVPPALPADFKPRPRHDPVGYAFMSLKHADLEPLDAIKKHLADFANDHEFRDLKWYLDHGQLLGSPKPLDTLSEHLQSQARLAILKASGEPNACYKNCYLASMGRTDIQYWEGIVWDGSLDGVQVQHAWLVIDDEIIDPTFIASKGDHNPQQVYFGTPFPNDWVNQVAITEEYVRPMALGPARSKAIQRVEEQFSRRR